MDFELLSNSLTFECRNPQLPRRMAEQEEEKLTLEDQYSSLAEEVEKKTNKLRRVWSKYQQVGARFYSLAGTSR